MTELRWQISNARELAAHAREWDALVALVGYPPFLRTPFLIRALAAFGRGSELLALGYREGTVTFAAIVHRGGIARWKLFQPSQLPLGACISVAGIDWPHALSSLARNLPGPTVAISVTQQDPLFVERHNSARLETLDYVPTAWIDVDQTFEEFWLSRGKNLRQNLRKQRRKLEEQGLVLDFTVLTKTIEVLSAFADYALLESQGWKSDAGSAISMENQQGKFYKGVLDDFSRNGSALVYRLTLNGRPIAVDFGLRDGKSVVILKTTYEEGMKGISPAQLLHEQIFQHHFQLRDVARIEFYGRVMEWHSRWTERSRMLFHANYFRAPGLKLLRKGLKRLSEHGKP